MEASGEPQAIPISDLSIEQMTVLQRQVEQEISFFAESLKELKTCHAKFAASEAAIDGIDPNEPRKEALIPLSESMYIKANLVDPAKVLVEIGTGYFVEMKNEQAKDYLKRKQDYLRKQMDTVEGILPEKKRAQQTIIENLRKKIQTSISQMPPPSK